MELVFVNNYHEKYDIYEKHFLVILKKTLKIMKIKGNVIVEVNLVDNDEIHRINKEYRHKDYPTDVISFAFDDRSVHDKAIVDAPFHDLGIIIISVEKALEQARLFGHTANRELRFLFTHGLLHLCGEDHDTEEKEKNMLYLQDKIIGKRKSP